ncbi:PaaX family transcriptional regulator C-terminal domain-containing protein [Paenibacillus kobensis]|uniref:PaaX family transcriptional regulator C-terminal domain-containing protein n=1 Tax=Paenibacillus kobensis TaxID=59841 RepID=UPI000FD7DDE8|nr:PaaX family transcriptional regulator C-terminal domain-containing protein [Paenibacillus kobensis]
MISVEKQMLFLLSKADNLETQELIRIYAKRGYSAAYIRNMLSRLKKDRYVDSPSRSTYRITDAGRAFVHSINRKPQLYGEQWDGQWHLVLTAFPEAERKRREQVRAALLQTGFGHMYSGVYLSPWAYREELAELFRLHEAEPYTTVFSGRLEGGPLSPEQAVKIWALPEIAEKYEEKRRWFHDQFEPSLAEALGTNREMTDALDVFVLYLALGEQISELYLIDPMLPFELLPHDWIGREVLQQLTHCADQVAAAIPRDSDYARFVR